MLDRMLLPIYNIATLIIRPFLPAYMRSRIKKGREDWRRKPERYGTPAHPRPEGPLIWMHGASVGETMMALPVIKELLERDPKLHILVTSGTVTSAEMLNKRLPDRAFHQYAPVDIPQLVLKFLAHWRPDTCIWLESDLWPNMIRLAKKRGAKMVLLNARLSEKSRKGWAKYPQTAQKIFSCFDLILPADQATASSISQFCGRDIEVFGNLKSIAPPLNVDHDHYMSFKDSIGERPVWCAASTHKGEDEIIIKAHQEILKTHPKALLILVPRHPERADDITRLIEESDLSYQPLNAPIKTKTQIMLIDKMGEMGLAYRLSSVVFVAGSLLPTLAGHNPLEPARLNNAVLSGPYVSSFDDLYKNMSSAGGVSILNETDAASLATAITLRLSDKTLQKDEAEKAANYVTETDALADQLFDALDAFIPHSSEIS